MQINFVDTLRYFSILRYASMYTLTFDIVLSKLSFSINRPNFSYITNIGNEIKEDK